MNPELHERLKAMGLQPSTGCWVDGHWGQYAVARMVEIAEDYGYADQEIIDIAHKHLRSIGPSTSPPVTDVEFGTLMDAADEVEEWLNENVARDGLSFGWHDGELFYMNTEWWEQD